MSLIYLNLTNYGVRPDLIRVYQGMARLIGNFRLRVHGAHFDILLCMIDVLKGF